MDIDMIIELIKNMPQDKLGDDETIKLLIDQAATASGKTMTEDRLNELLQSFKQFSQSDESSLISQLLFLGGNVDIINEVNDKLNSSDSSDSTDSTDSSDSSDS